MGFNSAFKGLIDKHKDNRINCFTSAWKSHVSRPIILKCVTF